MSADTFFFGPVLTHKAGAYALAVAVPGLFVGNEPASCIKGCESWFGKHLDYQKMNNTFIHCQNATSAGKPFPKIEQENWTEGIAVRWLIPEFAKSSKDSV